MVKKKASRDTPKPVIRFSVDLGNVNLNNKEVSSLKNKIIQMAVAAARKKGPKPPKRPYAKITFVKSIPPY